MARWRGGLRLHAHPFWREDEGNTGVTKPERRVDSQDAFPVSPTAPRPALPPALRGRDASAALGSAGWSVPTNSLRRSIARGSVGPSCVPRRRRAGATGSVLSVLLTRFSPRMLGAFASFRGLFSGSVLR